MQLPVVVLKLKGTLYVLEYCPSTAYDKLQNLMEKLVPEQKLSVDLNREALKILCDMASTEADRKLLRVASTAGMSGLQGQRIYGISNLHKERDEVAQAVQEYNKIRQAVDDVVNAKEKVVLETLGYFESDSGEDDDSLDSQSDCESNQLNTASSSESTEGTSDHKEGHLGVILEAGQLKSGAIDMGKTQLERNNPSESNQGTSDGKESHVGVVLKAS